MDLTRTILLIEEDDELRRVFRDLLEKMGYWVIATPRIGIVPRVYELAARVDLLVSDVTVPDSDSIALTQELLARRGDLPTVLMSTDDTEVEVRRRFKDGRTRFLTKPFSIDELRRVVGEAVALLSVPEIGAGAEASTAERFRPIAAPRSWGPRHLAAWGFAVAAMLVVVVSFVLPAGSPAPPPLPGSVEQSVPRGHVLKLVEPRGDWPELPSAFSWEEVADAANYRIVIQAVDDTVLWEGTSGVGNLPIEPDAASVLHAGVVYYWTVEALDGRGEPLVRSQPTRFQVVPPRID